MSTSNGNGDGRYARLEQRNFFDEIVALRDSQR